MTGHPLLFQLVASLDLVGHIQLPLSTSNDTDRASIFLDIAIAFEM